ncbi:MAG: hypothetical protein Q4C90_11805 [Kocuria sp.]|uniref:Phosphate transport regulator n=1 Tax=Kocuria varians TaxID=1272 RepID=A0A7D7Q357_KOCVA|nr:MULTISPECIES: hypothetical protein [Kocuria]WNB87955.1 hypothetical protein RGB72_08085 [Glutamicibacter protophormiae]MDO4257821.1 hypothetical protein [Kocuria sp.]QMS56477.1 hypothetical protein CIB50_0001182 [Kocuria varians]RUP83999.1 hypothetical protein D8M39_06200 [Kocuria sp. HSID17590]RUQ07671.1 hypothetical protein D8M38_08585 [Kocuria sp. HSID17582]
MAFRIFPEDERVTDLLVQMAQCVLTAVEQLSEHLGQIDKVWELPITDLLDTEDRCTNLYFSLMTTTRSSYVVPIPRQDVYVLGHWLLRAVQCLVACAELHRQYKVERPSSHATEQLAVIQHMAHMTLKAMGRLTSLEELDDYWFEMIRLTRQAERTQRSYRASLLDEFKAGQAIRRMDTAQQLFDAAQALGQVSSEVGRILVAES